MKIPWMSFIGPIFLCIPVLGQPATSDLKLTIRYTSGNFSSTATEYSSGENSRSEMQYSSGSVMGHHHAVIRQRGAETMQVYDLDLEAHEFVSYRTDLRGLGPGAKPLAVKQSGKTFAINIDTVDTGETKEMFGQLARHLITREKRTGGPENCYGGDSETEIDGWYISFDALPAWRRPKAASVGSTLLMLKSQEGERCSDKIEVHRTGPVPGYPLKLRTTMRSAGNNSIDSTSVSEQEVLEFSQTPLDPALFQVPAGFKKVSK